MTSLEPGIDPGLAALADAILIPPFAGTTPPLWIRQALDRGLAGVTLLIALSGVIGLPGTELPMLFAGFNVYQHHLTLLGIIVAGVLGDTLGASLAYAIGYYGRRELLERPEDPGRRGGAGEGRDEDGIG